MPAMVAASSITLVPPATEAPASPSSRPRCARWAATSDDEQAVSVLTQGPAGWGEDVQLHHLPCSRHANMRRHKQV